MSDKTETIIVTGGAGFIGSNFLNRYVLEQPQWQFVNVDCLTYAGNLDNLTISDRENYAFAAVNICDQAALREVFETHRPTKVIHFAAESHVDRSLDDPAIFIDTNVKGTNNLLALAHEYQVSRYHQISTDEVYGALSATDEPFTETSPLQPRNPYSASKAAADMMVRAYHETYGLDTVITRSSNVFGPNQDTSKLIPHFIDRLLHDQTIPLYGEGLQIREWTYVEDCITALYQVLTEGQAGEVYNIGSRFELTNIAVTKEILNVLKKDESMIEYVADRQGHDFRYSLDTTKVETQFGWQPQISFTAGLEKTIAYVRTLSHD